MKRKALAALAVVAFIAAGVVIWQAVAALLWVAYYAGIPV